MAKAIALAQNLGLLTFGLLLAALGGELLVRFLAPQPLYRFPRGMYIEDPILQYRLADNFSGIAKTTEYRTSIRTNSVGLRDAREYADPKPDDVFRILALGDSFTMGVGVELENSFVKVLERGLTSQPDAQRYEVLNAGIPGYNTEQEIAYLRDHGRKFHPDLVLVNFYVGNDINDNYYKPRIFVVDGYLTEGLPQQQGVLNREMRLMLEVNSHLYHFLWPYWQRIFHADAQQATQQRRDDILSIYSTHPDAQTTAMWNATRQQLSDLAGLARDSSLKIAIVIIPDPLQVDPDLWKHVKQAERPGITYRIDEPNERLLAFCARLGLPALDLLPAFSDPKSASETYLQVDGHWTVRGNALAAKVVLEFLWDRNLVGRSRFASRKRIAIVAPGGG